MGYDITVPDFQYVCIEDSFLIFRNIQGGAENETIIISLITHNPSYHQQSFYPCTDYSC